MAKIRSSRWALRRGQRLARAGKLDASLAAFGTAGDTNDFQLLTHHALTLARAGQGDAALERSATAAAAAPDDVVPAVFNAYVMLRSGRLDEAKGELDRAAKLSPRNPIVHSLSAVVDMLAGKLVQGCEKLLAGAVTDNLEMLGWILAVIERKVFERVGTDSGAIPPDVEGGPKADVTPSSIPDLSVRACAKRGERLLESGKPKKALKYLERAVQLKPDDAAHRAMYGAALFEASEFERAEAELVAAPKKGPLAGVAQFYHAANAYRLDQYETALELLDTLPMVGDVFLFSEWCDYIRGMALVALDRTGEAAPHLAAFIDSEPAVVERRLKKAIAIFRESDPCSTQS